MKSAGLKVELVTEYAKDLVYERNFTTLSDQLLVLAEQSHRLQRLVGAVDFAITDSPLLLGLVYAEGRWLTPWMEETITGVFEMYDNTNFFVTRVKPYQTFGRREDEASARAVDTKIKGELLHRGYPFIHVTGDESAPELALGIMRRSVRGC